MPDNLAGILIIGGGIALILISLSKRVGAAGNSNQAQASLTNVRQI